jgi:Rrf2 family iron-sulfur cluster assembly transcriptional regulator
MINSRGKDRSHSDPETTVLSQTAEYALRTVLFLADRDEAARADEIAQRLQIPRNYLSKTLHRLAREGVLLSTRGKGGGFRLAVPPDRLKLLRVVAPFDGISAERRCLLGRPQCSDRNPCPAHYEWKSVSERVTAFFRDRTVEDLLRGT